MHKLQNYYKLKKNIYIYIYIEFNINYSCGGMNLSLRRYCPLLIKTLTDLFNLTLGNLTLGRNASHPQHLSMRSTPHMWAHTYMLWVGGISPLREIEQIYKGLHRKRTIPSKEEIRPSTMVIDTINLRIFYLLKKLKFVIVTFLFFLSTTTLSNIENK